MARFYEQYLDPSLAWPPGKLESWTPEVLAEEELDEIRSCVQTIIAAMTNHERRTSLSDQRQLTQALTLMRRMRTLWSALLTPGRVLPTGEASIPVTLIRQSLTYNVRDWTFGRERRAVHRRKEFTTVSRQAEVHARYTNRIITYYSTEIDGLLNIRGK